MCVCRVEQVGHTSKANSDSEQHFQNGFGRQIDLLMMKQLKDSHDGKKAKREPRMVQGAVSVPGEGQW